MTFYVLKTIFRDMLYFTKTVLSEIVWHAVYTTPKLPQLLKAKEAKRMLLCNVLKKTDFRVIPQNEEFPVERKRKRMLGSM
jgi:hypothetical protein